MSLTNKSLTLLSTITLMSLAASSAFAQVGPVTGNPANHGGYYPCTDNSYCVSICGDACFCNIESRTTEYGAPYNVCWVDMNSEKTVDCKGQANLFYEENKTHIPLCDKK